MGGMLSGEGGAAEPIAAQAPQPTNEVIDNGHENDLCLANNGGCHAKALCLDSTPDGLGIECICEEGFTGDGYTCEKLGGSSNANKNKEKVKPTTAQPETPAPTPAEPEKPETTAGHENDLCLANNGGCHVKALCLDNTPDGRGIECICEEGFTGDGYTCDKLGGSSNAINNKEKVKPTPAEPEKPAPTPAE